MKFFFKLVGLIIITFVLSSCNTTKTYKVENTNNQNTLLHNSWALENIEGSMYSKGDTESIPTLIIDLKKNEFYGSDGCNNIFGDIMIDQNNLKLERKGTTMMACPNLEFSSKYHNLLDDVSSFKINGDDLKLMNNSNDIILEFKKSKK